MDVSVEPPSYGIQFTSSSGSGFRETEASRLRPRQPGTAAPPPPAAVQPAAPAAAAAAAAAAADQRAAGGSGLPPAGFCTPEEQTALLQVLQHQIRGVRAAAAAARAEALSAAADPPRPAATAAAAPAVLAALAPLLHSSVAYCSQQLTAQHWEGVLEQLRAAFAQCSAALAAAAGRVAATVSAAAGEVAVGADMQSPAVALQFFRRLKLKGVLERSAKVCFAACR